jgi:hypothetical protein
MSSSDRADKVLALLGREGALEQVEGLLSFGVINPWSPLVDYDETVTAQVAAQGGAAVSVLVGSSFGNVGTFRLALLWDDEVLAAPLVVVEEDTQVVIKVGEPKGTRLTLWGDAVVPISPGPVGPPGDADKIAAALAAKAQQPNPSGFLATVEGGAKTLVDKLFSFETASIQTVIVVGGLVALGYLLFSGPVNKVAARVAGGAV